eukprot:CAMPEP_0114499106 /NCGR_PEP_ID=MMETSP0109-20121206/7234_1 /TAXON_ID=29199 /ORGANISM="Chlorarachnion reptans, Strain CCCM449" /LENGTH=312 /DNA_ID=CAMNT_0001676639 /DNA_START=414 /DNA_END=1352 /DNA_ORIENTATION=-
MAVALAKLRRHVETMKTLTANSRAHSFRSRAASQKESPVPSQKEIPVTESKWRNDGQTNKSTGGGGGGGFQSPRKNLNPFLGGSGKHRRSHSISVSGKAEVCTSNSNLGKVGSTSISDIAKHPSAAPRSSRALRSPEIAEDRITSPRSTEGRQRRSTVQGLMGRGRGFTNKSKKSKPRTANSSKSKTIPRARMLSFLRPHLGSEASISHALRKGQSVHRINFAMRVTEEKLSVKLRNMSIAAVVLTLIFLTMGVLLLYEGARRSSSSYTSSEAHNEYNENYDPVEDIIAFECLFIIGFSEYYTQRSTCNRRS